MLLCPRALIENVSSRGAPARIDAPDHVALFTYDNGAFVFENFRDDAARVNVMGKSDQFVTIPPHSFRVFKP